MDKLTKDRRSWNMSRVKSKNTKPELLMFKMLKERGIKFEKHYSIFGTPDIAFPENKLAVFIDGEFWHGKDFKILKTTISPFWVKKIGDNIKRDKKTVRNLTSEGWHVLRLWDKRVIRYPEQSIRRIMRLLERVKIPDV